jgi:hypothetical protein
MTAECDLHGVRESRFLCQHLTPESEGLGFVFGADDEAWCVACERVWDAEREWNDVIAKQLSVKHVCDICFDDIRKRNELPVA